MEGTEHPISHGENAPVLSSTGGSFLPRSRGRCTPLPRRQRTLASSRAAPFRRCVQPGGRLCPSRRETGWTWQRKVTAHGPLWAASIQSRWQHSNPRHTASPLFPLGGVSLCQDGRPQSTEMGPIRAGFTCIFRRIKKMRFAGGPGPDSCCLAWYVVNCDGFSHTPDLW